MIVGDATSDILHSALRGLAQRQRVTADNIANIQTPGFLAGRVDFEGSLRQAVSTGDDAAGVRATVQRSLEPTRADGNNVDLDTETVTATETGLRYQLVLRALDGRYDTLRAAMRGS